MPKRIEAEVSTSRSREDVVMEARIEPVAHSLEYRGSDPERS